MPSPEELLPHGSAKSAGRACCPLVCCRSQDTSARQKRQQNQRLERMLSECVAQDLRVWRPSVSVRIFESPQFGFLNQRSLQKAHSNNGWLAWLIWTWPAFQASTIFDWHDLTIFNAASLAGPALPPKRRRQERAAANGVLANQGFNAAHLVSWGLHVVQSFGLQNSKWAHHNLSQFLKTSPS